MRTRCKVQCQSVTKTTGWNGVEFMFSAKFFPVTATNPENSKFFASTPGGEINLTTIREDHFKPGAFYFVDFVEVVPEVVPEELPAPRVVETAAEPVEKR